MLQVLVHRYEDVADGGHSSHQLTVLDARPAGSTDRGDDVPLDSAANSSGRFSSRRTRTSKHRIARGFERSDGSIARHTRKLAQEFIERLATFEIVKQRLDRHAGADKDRRAAKGLWVGVDSVLEIHSALGDRVLFSIHQKLVAWLTRIRQRRELMPSCASDRARYR